MHIYHSSSSYLANNNHMSITDILLSLPATHQATANNCHPRLPTLDISSLSECKSEARTSCGAALQKKLV